jgi:hypothetical protein
MLISILYMYMYMYITINIYSKLILEYLSIIILHL